MPGKHAQVQQLLVAENSHNIPSDFSAHKQR